MSLKVSQILKVAEQRGQNMSLTLMYLAIKSAVFVVETSAL
jgi:hypothetical protein